MALRAVLFDAAGTLFRVRGSVGLAYAGVAARHGVALPAAHIEERFRRAFRSMPPMCFPGVAAAELPRHEQAWWKQVVRVAFAESRFPDFDAFFDQLFEHFARPESWEVFPDAVPALAALKARGFRLAVVSNFDGRLERICVGLGLSQFFDTIVMSARVGCAKPDPRIFSIALHRVGVRAADAVHVGDSETDDLAGAAAAGVRGVLVRRGTASGDAPDRVRDLRQLITRC
jgi:putative hydrolase of the HAD superfamily